MMGRRGNLRGQPRLLLTVIFVVCLVIFYLSWKSLVLDVKNKNIYSVQGHNLFVETEKWKAKTYERAFGRNQFQDHVHPFGSASSNKKENVMFLQNYQSFSGKEKINNKNLKIKPHVYVTKPSEIKKNVWSESKEFYRQPNNMIIETVKSMERFVHLDLKGAPPKMSYLKLFIPLIVKLGATGLLIEYEDMFPYTGLLENIHADNAYSMSDIEGLLNLAKKYHLKVMPLIQTFGQMEFILKSGFMNMRESVYNPQVIDVTQNASYVLISEMIKQILNAHSYVTYLHIGCAEPYLFEKEESSIEMQRKSLSKSQMFLQHVSRVASIVRKQTGTTVTPVIWDDMLREMPSSVIENSKLSSLVEIMVRQYSTNVLQFINNDVWNKYARVFKSVWIASAFKGAKGARQTFTEPKHYLKNHLSWLDVIAENKHHLNFKGIVLTGSQRYDHFSTLCELLPVAIPSLALCLATMRNAGFTEKIHKKTSVLLKCHRPLELTFQNSGINLSTTSEQCLFPGESLYYTVKLLYGHRISSLLFTTTLDGWLSDYQVAHGFSNLNHLRVLARSLAKESSYYTLLTVPLRTYLTAIYSANTVDEWIDENIHEQQRRIEEIEMKIHTLQQSKSWSKHSFIPVHNGYSSDVDDPNNKKYNNVVIKSKNGMNVQSDSAQAAEVKFSNTRVLPNQTKQKMPFKISSTALESKQLYRKQFTSVSHQETSVALKTPFGISDFEKTDDERYIQEMITDSNIERKHEISRERNKEEKYSTR